MPQVHLKKQFTTSKNDVHTSIPVGKTLQEIIDDIKLPSGLEESIHVYINGYLVDNKYLDKIKPKEGVNVKIVIVPQGGDNGGLLKMIAMIAITVWSGGAGATMFGAGTFGAAAFTVGVSMASSLAMNALFPPPDGSGAIGAAKSSRDSSPALTIGGSKNQASYNKSCQCVYGTVKMFPPYAAQSFTVSHSGSQYVYLLFDLGYGDISVSDLKIGDTAITDYEEVSYNVLNVTSPEDLVFFTNDIESEAINIEMTTGDPAVIRTSKTEQKYIQFDIMFSNGLYGVDNNNEDVAEDVTFTVVLRDAGGTLMTTSEYTLYALPDQTLTITYPTLDSFKVEGMTDDGFGISLQITPTIVTDTVTLELTRSASSTNGIATNSRCSYSVLRTFRLGAALGESRLIDGGQVSRTMIEMRIRATDQLNGIIDSFSLIASAKLRTYDGASFTAPIVTDNPAWIYADILTGQLNQRPKADNRINWTELKRWADYCDILTIGEHGTTKAHTCNFVLDYSSTIYSLLKEIAAIGKAAPDIYDDTYSIIFEEEKTTKVQLFSNHNTSNFSSSLLYTELPDAVKVNFRDPDSGWQMRELIVYNDGFTSANAKVFESIDSPKTTSSDEAYRNGRYWLKQATLRRETVTFDTDLEWLECKRGSFVGFQHDVIKTGGTSGRVRAVNGTVLTMDTKPDMNGNAVDYFELRPQNGSVIKGFVAYYNSGSPLEVDIGVAGASAGDLVIFNSSGTESYDLLVKYIDVNPDKSAKITCVEYAPALFDLASLPVPVYTPHIGSINTPNKVPLIIESLTATEELMLINKLSYITITLDYLPAFGTVPTSYIIYKQADDFTWEREGNTTETSFVWGKEILAINNPIIGIQHNFSVVAVSETGEHIDPAIGRQVSIVPLGDTTIPPAPDVFTVENTAENFRRFWWSYVYSVEPDDLKGFLIRYTRSTLQDWLSATPLHDGILISPPFEIRALPQGAQTVMIRSIDTSNNLSIESRKISFNMGERPTENVLFTEAVGGIGLFEQKILSSDIQAGDAFGISVSISGDGNTAIAGAYLESSGASLAGAAYIFTKSGSTWTEEQKIQASDLQLDDFFGKSVSISNDGNTAIVGATEEDTGGANAGAAYIFTRSVGVWTEQQKILSSDIQAGDAFGRSVSISGDGNNVIVGADSEDTGGADAGAAYIFTRSGSTWTEEQKIQASDLQTFEYFGKSVSISSDGNTAIVGAYLETSAGVDAGAAYIFTRSGSTWTEEQKIQASDTRIGDYFGISVSISGDGDTVIIGANGEDSGGYDSGAAYVFTRSVGVWTEQQKLLSSDIQGSDFFGISVSISDDGNNAIVGATGESRDGSNSGAAYTFTRSGSVWTEEQNIKASDASSGDYFGQSVSISSDGHDSISGAYLEGAGGAGAIYMLARTGGVEKWDGYPIQGNPVIDGNNRLSVDTSTSGVMWNSTTGTLMWQDDISLMWQSPNDSFKWISNISIPAGGITTLDWVGDGEIKTSYAHGTFPESFTQIENLLTHPESFDTIHWADLYNRFTVTADTDPTPDQTVNRADTITATSTASIIIRQVPLIDTSGGGVYSFSIWAYVKSGTITSMDVNLGDGTVADLSSQISGATELTRINVDVTSHAINNWLDININFPSSGAEIVLWGALLTLGEMIEYVPLSYLRHTGSGQGVIPYTSPINLTPDDYVVIVESPISVDVNRLDSLTWTTDVPDINEWFNDLVVASTGDTVITLTKTFIAVTNVGIVLQSDGNNADSCRVISKTNTTITVRCYSGTTTQVQGLIDMRIQGY